MRDGGRLGGQVGTEERERRKREKKCFRTYVIILTRIFFYLYINVD